MQFAKHKNRFTLLAGALALCISTCAVAAGPYPSGPIHLVVGFPPGGINDIVARIVGEKLGESLGQTVVVDNKSGAGGTIGANYVAKASPDGYTLLLGSVSNLAMAPGQYPELPYSPTASFAPIALVAAAPNVLVVNPSFKVNNVTELIKAARDKPGMIMFASAGQGTSNHLTGVLLSNLAHIQLVHVPYKGDTPAIADVVAGQVPMMFPTVPVAIPFIKSGQVKAIAVSSKTRTSLLPDVPTVAEAGGPADFEVSVWVGILAPSGTPQPIIDRVQSALKEIVQLPEMKTRFNALGAEPSFMGAAQFGRYLDSETVKWAELAKSAKQP
jgi:tripartite-type tricarboxylate transporter receptor subunit TctC